MRMDATPHVAIVHDGSRARTSRKVFSAALYQNECSIATPVSSSGCTLGSHELENFTRPSWPVASPSLASTAVETTDRATETARQSTRAFISFSFGRTGGRP